MVMVEETGLKVAGYDKSALPRLTLWTESPPSFVGAQQVSSSSFVIPANSAGLLILYPFKCRIGSTAPSRIRFRNA